VNIIARMEAIKTNDAPAAIGPYSQATKSGEMVFMSGQIALDPTTGAMVEGDVSAQAVRVLENLGGVLKAAGCGFKDVVRTTIFLRDMRDFQAVNAVYARYFAEPFPARATVAVAGLPRDALVEIDAIAVR
jgi:2-iminobutanoate/2-iminopropanoate deaminase